MKTRESEYSHSWLDFEEVEFTEWAELPVEDQSVERPDRTEQLMQKVLSVLDQGVSFQADFKVVRDEFGRFVVSDPYGAAIGVGDTRANAVADWELAATEVLADIEQFEGGLHQRIARQRDYLRSVLD